MGRKRLTLRLIENRRARLATFSKRLCSLKKKARELHTLCGVDVLVVCVGPNNVLHTSAPNDDPAEGRRIAERFCALSNREQTRNAKTLADVLGHAMPTAAAPPPPAPTPDDPLSGLSKEELLMLKAEVEEAIKTTTERIETIKNSEGTAAAPATMYFPMSADGGPSSYPYNDQLGDATTLDTTVGGGFNYANPFEYNYLTNDYAAPAAANPYVMLPDGGYYLNAGGFVPPLSTVPFSFEKGGYVDSWLPLEEEEQPGNEFMKWNIFD